ncbi:MAG TPA: hypothetical protein VF510_19075 [Ktedonobacterales bacterium]
MTTKTHSAGCRALRQAPIRHVSSSGSRRVLLPFSTPLASAPRPVGSAAARLGLRCPAVLTRVRASGQAARCLPGRH